MNWTTQKPTTFGWYWWRDIGFSTGVIVQVDMKTGTVSSSGTDEYRLLKEIVGENGLVHCISPNEYVESLVPIGYWWRPLSTGHPLSSRS